MKISKEIPIKWYEDPKDWNLIRIDQKWYKILEEKWVNLRVRGYITSDNNKRILGQIVEDIELPYDRDGIYADWHNRDGLNVGKFNRKWEYKNLKWVKTDPEWFDFEGFNDKWFKKWGLHRNGTFFDDDRYNINDRDKDWYDRSWLDENYFNRKKEYKNQSKVLFNEKWFNSMGLTLRGFRENHIHKNGTKYDNDWYDYDWLDENHFNQKKEYRNHPGILFDDDWLGFERFNEKWFKYLGWVHSNWSYLDNKGNDANYYRTEEMKILAWFKQEFIHRNGKYWDDEWYDYYDRDEDWFDRNKLDENWFNRAREYKNQPGVFFDEDWYNYLRIDRNWFSQKWLHTSWVSFRDFIAAMLAEKKYELSTKIYNDRKIYTTFLSWDNFQELTRNQIKKYIAEYTYTDKDLGFYSSKKLPNIEQIDIIADMSQYLLVKARAGCGKTTTLTYKTHFLIKELNIKSDEIIFLAFNKKAASEINKKFEESGMSDFQNAMTFHSLAGRLLSWSRKENRDFEEDIDYKKDQALPDSIRNILKDDEQRKKVYNFYKQEIDIFDKKTLGVSQEKYVYMRDNSHAIWAQKFCTLDGRTLKSIWEKWVADFLFEHNLDYKYEWNLIWPHENFSWYQPDFCLCNFSINNVIANSDDPFSLENLTITKKPISEKTWIEFFWIDDLDPTKSTPPWWTKSFHEYVKEMSWKRNIFKEDGHKDHTLIEMNERERRDWRDNFEFLLKSKLENIGIVCNKLDEETLLRKVLQKNKSKIEERVESFIRKCMHRRWSPDQVTVELIKNNFWEPLDTFYEFSIDCYREYLRRMQEKWKQDFEMILMDAISYINEKKWDIDFRIHKEKDKKTVRWNIQKLKYIIIDEYQDTSELFYEIIQEIRKYNSNLKIICVWDDWQLINSFAGSEMRFFTNFSHYYPWANLCSLRTTYRCTERIVEAANTLMKSPWELKSWCSKKQPGFIEFLENSDWEDTAEENQKYWNIDIKTFIEKILENRKDSPDEIRTFRILSRTNYDLKDFLYADKKAIDSKTMEEIMYDYRKRTENLDEYKKNVKSWLILETAHKSKGMESDYVLLLKVGDNFPMIHPDNIYGIIFWETLLDILDEERRLFYVAITRAKYGIYYTIWKNCENGNKDLVWLFNSKITKQSKI